MKVLPLLVLAFVTIPMAELYLLLAAGHAIGLVPTLAVVVFTAILGGWLTRLEGMRVLWRVRDELAAGRLPAAALLDGAIILVAGALLLTPGFITDACGFFLLAPPTRSLVRGALVRRLRRHVVTMPSSEPDDGDVIDAEWRER